MSSYKIFAKISAKVIGIESIYSTNASFRPAEQITEKGIFHFSPTDVMWNF